MAERSERLNRATEDLVLATAPGAPKLVAAEVAREVEAAWSDLRRQITDVTSYMGIALMGEFLPDIYSDDNNANVNDIEAAERAAEEAAAEEEVEEEEEATAGGGKRRKKK